MLSLQLKSGEYITIGDDIVVQIFQDGPVNRVSVQAPRELTILRGEVQERDGGRPDGLLKKRPASPARREHNLRQSAKLAQKTAKRRSAAEELTAIAGELSALTENAATHARLQALLSRLETLAD